MFRLFTGNAQVIHKKLQVMQATLDAWEAFVPHNGAHMRRLETQIEDLRQEIHDHKQALHKLRGQVHGPRAQEVERLPSRQVQHLTTKEQLRMKAGIVAGRPAPQPQDDEE